MRIKCIFMCRLVAGMPAKASADQQLRLQYNVPFFTQLDLVPTSTTTGKLK
jgi:hypothetical protein